MFVDRMGGKITATYAASQYEGQEELPDDDKEIAEFRTGLLVVRERTAEQKLAAIGLSVAELKELLGLN